MNYLLLFLATFAAASKFIMCKKIGHDSSDKKRMFLYNGVIFFTAAAVVLLSLAKNLDSVVRISLFSFLLAALFAGFLLFTQVTETLAMNFGSVSMTMMIYSCGFLLPIIYGLLFLGEGISLYQILGLFVLIIALILIISPKKNERFSVLWLLFSVFSMIGSGTNAIIQKIHQASDFKNELLPFLFFALLFSSVFSFIAFFLTRGGTSGKETHRKSIKSTLTFLVLGGLCVGILNILNLRLAGKLPAAVQFPVYSIGSMILTGLAGRFIYKEILSKRKLVGFGIGCVAITVIALL